MMKKIIFICQCNICRSPMAEFILKYLMRRHHDVEIMSAGLSNEKEGSDMTNGAKECLLAHGIPFEPRAAAVFQSREYDNYDLIICMDEWNQLNLKLKCFGDPAHKIHKLLTFSKSAEGLSAEDAMLALGVSDPYYSNQYERTFQEIYEGCEALKRKLETMENKSGSGTILP